MSNLLKKDIFGEIRLVTDNDVEVIVRDISTAKPWIRWLARSLMKREATALAALSDVNGVPKLNRFDRNTLTRSFICGVPMHVARPTDHRFYVAAAQLLRQMHCADVVHNDLAKEPNVVVDSTGNPAFLDFQLAWFGPSRTRLFRVLGREDVRHLLKHKRTYCAEHLTRREQSILAHPSILSRLWMITVKPLYLFITRNLMGWSDREGAGDRAVQK